MAPQICCVCGKIRKGHSIPFGKNCKQRSVLSTISKVPESNSIAKPVGRKCLKCFRPLKGHPFPRGYQCNLTPLLSEQEKKLGRTCLKCFRPLKGHPFPRGSQCTLTPLLSEQEKKLKKTKERKSKNYQTKRTKQVIINRMSNF